MKDAYLRQLQLYAYLEHEATGSWPSSGHLLPFTGSAVEANVSSEECVRIASEAEKLLDDFNETVPRSNRLILQFRPVDSAHLQRSALPSGRLAIPNGRQTFLPQRDAW